MPPSALGPPGRPPHGRVRAERPLLLPRKVVVRNRENHPWAALRTSGSVAHGPTDSLPDAFLRACLAGAGCPSVGAVRPSPAVGLNRQCSLESPGDLPVFRPEHV